MNLPTFHSCAWSDEGQAEHEHSDPQRPAQESPGSLVDKELHLWVTYPAVKRAKRKGRRTKFCRETVKLWAVMIVETVQKTGAFTYEVTLRRIYKRDDRTITVVVSNDPRDQSEEASVFGFVSPPARLITSLEQYLSRLVATRVYDAIAQTWPREDVSGVMTSGGCPPLQRRPEDAEGAVTVVTRGPTTLDKQWNG